MIDDPDIIKLLMIERNAQHLNQAEGYPFTIEPLAILIDKDSFTSFSEEILKGTANLSTLNLTPTTETYLKNLQRHKETMTLINKNIIPYVDYKQDFKKCRGKK